VAIDMAPRLLGGEAAASLAGTPAGFSLDARNVDLMTIDPEREIASRVAQQVVEDE